MIYISITPFNNKAPNKCPPTPHPQPVQGQRQEHKDPEPGFCQALLPPHEGPGPPSGGGAGGELMESPALPVGQSQAPRPSSWACVPCHSAGARLTLECRPQPVACWLLALCSAQRPAQLAAKRGGRVGICGQLTVAEMSPGAVQRRHPTPSCIRGEQTSAGDGDLSSGVEGAGGSLAPRDPDSQDVSVLPPGAQ